MYIGVDIGTSMTKAAGFDGTGRVLSVHSERTRLTSPQPGWFEQDINDVIGSVASVISRVVAETRTAPRLISLTGQGDGVWLQGRNGAPVRNAISWMDGRAGEIVERQISDGIVDEVFRRNGGVIFAGCPSAVLAWLDANEPESLDQAETAGYCKDAVMRAFTGVRATDPSDASLPYLDQRAPGFLTYEKNILALTGLAHRQNLLAPIVSPVPVGELSAEIAIRLGVPAGTKVTSGPFDLPAGVRGSGVSNVGDGHVTIGTTLACQVLVDRIDTSGEPSGLTIALPGKEEPAWSRAMPTMVGTAALDWVLRMVGEDHERVDGMLAESSPGAAGVRCLPYFSASGERAPFIEPAARARFDGLTVNATKADLVRATCEAIAFAGRHCLEAAGLTGEVAVCGGGIKSAEWLQIFADVLGRPVRVAPTPEVGALGAVLCGLDALREVSSDDLPDVHDVSDVRNAPAAWQQAANVSADTPIEKEAGRTVQPNGHLTDHYAQRYDDYLASVGRVRGEWKNL